MHIKKSMGEKIFDLFNIIILVVLMVVALYPMLHVLFASLSIPGRLMAHRGPLLMPLGLTIGGYKRVFANPNILTGYANTIIYVTLGTFINVIMTSLGAYVLSRKKLMLGKLFMFMVVFTMFFNGGLIPTYLLIKNLGLIDNRAVLVIPGAIAVWNLIILRTSFLAIPDSLEESAKLDGANDFTILFKIIIPLSKATIAVITLFYCVGHWNAWFNAMIYIRDRSKFPLQLILREILIDNDTTAMTQINDASDLLEEDNYKTLVQYCTIVVATIPILFVYPLLQKHFVKGVMIGSLKG